MVDEQEFKRWRASAGSALAGAMAQAEVGVHAWACFNCEQAAQLAVKALLHGIGAGPWGHDLIELMTMLRAEGFDVPEPLEESLRRLDRFYIQTRYPDAFASGDLAARFRHVESEQAIGDATGVLVWVDDAWERLR